MYQTLISTHDLAAKMKNAQYLLVDCRFNLADTTQGRVAYDAGHIAGAVYAHLDDDLSGKVVSGKTGRHPLPEIDQLTQLFSSWGIDKNTQVVAYDDVAGPFAARLWWMLRWVGHEKVAVLDGGMKKWRAEGRGIESKEQLNVNVIEKSSFFPVINESMCVDASVVLAAINDDAIKLIDARAGDRFCGQNETLDIKAGHIPGAVSSPFFYNLTEAGTFKPKETLLKEYHEKIGDYKLENIIMYCGSGVTAAHNILAMTYCGINEISATKGVKNYAGSWSDWITDDSRPIETC